MTATSRRSLFSLLAGMALLTACSEAPRVHQTQFLAMGTLNEVLVAGVDADRATAAFEVVEAVFRQHHARWHAWQTSPLTHLNQQLAEQGKAPLPAELRPALAQAQRLAAASGGLFNPAIGRLVDAWGFHTEVRPDDQPPPAPDAIAELLAAAPGMNDLRIEQGFIATDNPAVQLDVGAFVKGIAVDAAVERLRKLGIEHAIVNAGGDLRALGHRDERPWRIGIRDPRGAGVLAAIETRGDDSVFTSGDYERFFEYQGRRYHHILDPRTGYPAADTVSVTVLAPSAAVGDATATALFVAGPEQWQAVAHRMGIDHVMLIDRDGVAHMTPAMAERVHFETDTPPPVRLGHAP